MSADSKISVLICAHCPTLDHVRMLCRALETVCKQTRKPDEIVVVLDECIPDAKILAQEQLSQRLKTDIPYQLIRKPKKEGLAAAKNFGLRYCTGDWITYCDADDEWLPCKLEVQEEAVLEHDPDFCFTQAWDSYDGLWKPNCFRVGHYEFHYQIRAMLQHENVLCHGSAMIRASKLKALRGYRDVRGMEDWDLWKRALLFGYKFYNVPERLYVYSMGTSVER